MPRRPQSDPADSPARYWLERMTASGPDAPPVEEQLELLQILRSSDADATAEADKWLVTEVHRLRAGLDEASEAQAHLKGVLAKMTFTPWHPAVVLGALMKESGPAVQVSCGGARRVVGLAEGVVPDSLSFGDEVFLSRDLSVVMQRSESAHTRAGDTAEFQRCLPDGRIVLKRRDEAFVVRAANTLAVDSLVQGDTIRWDPALAIAFEKIGRSHESSLFLEYTPSESFSEIGGLDRQIALLTRSLRLHLLHPDVVRRYRLRRAGSVLLVGPPGTGKTITARALAHWLGTQSPSGRARFIHIKPGALHSVWYSQSEANYREAFRVAREAAAQQPDVPVVMFFDEVDAIGQVRGEGPGRVDDRVLTAFMSELDGLESRGSVLVVAATNRREAVDPALLRPGRLGDLILEIPRPNMAAAAAVFERHLPADIPYAGDAADDDGARRRGIIEAAVSRLYAPNGHGEVASIMFRDGTRRALHPRDVISGASIANIARSAIERACTRDVEHGDAGVHADDVLDAIADELQSAVGALTPANCHAFIGGLPQDLAVVRVEPIVRRVRQPHRFVSAA